MAIENLGGPCHTQKPHHKTVLQLKVDLYYRLPENLMKLIQSNTFEIIINTNKGLIDNTKRQSKKKTKYNQLMT